jgi:hypothetical protein
MLNAVIFWTNDDEHLDLTIDPQTGHVVKSQDKQMSAFSVGLPCGR